jgi:hypothetical protein
MNIKVPGEVDALSYQTSDQGDPTAADLRRVVTRIGYNRVARSCAAGEGFVIEKEADLLMVLALEGLDAREAAERREQAERDTADAWPGAGAG